MIDRVKKLIDKGYDKDVIFDLINCSKEELDKCIDYAINNLLKDVTSVANPVCIYIGGQPGVGKSVLSHKLKKNSNSVEISMDACRMYHPKYSQIEKYINSFYETHEITNENNPGNDIASFTQDFSAKMVNKLIDMISDKGVNILLEWNMRNSLDVLNCMEKLKYKGYKNDAIVVATNKETSLEACKLRADIMNSCGHIARRVPDSFHQLCIDTIPDSVNNIYEIGTEKNILNSIKVILRDGTIKWMNQDVGLPGNVLTDIYNGKNLKEENSREYAMISFLNESVGLTMQFNKNIIDKSISL